MNNLLFIHNKPKVFNIGDYLCTPIHYFDFGLRIHNNKLFLKENDYNCIVGGGAYKEHASNAIKDVKAGGIVTWAIGSSENSKITSPNLEKFHRFSTRDIKVANDFGVEFLPCVSVLSDLVDVPVGDKVGVFLNHDTDITESSDIETIKSYCESNDIVFGTNSLSPNAFKKVFSGTNRIITNSYHVIYWSLLSGRSIKILGYSSKFYSLLDMFDLNEEAITRYEPRKGQLKTKVYELLKTDNYFRIENNEELKGDFRRMNINFANSLVESGFVPKAELNKKGHITSSFRYAKYRLYMSLKMLKNKNGF